MRQGRSTASLLEQSKRIRLRDVREIPYSLGGSTAASRESRTLRVAAMCYAASIGSWAILTLKSENFEKLVEAHRSTSVSANREKLLQYFLRKSNEPGDRVTMSGSDIPVIDVVNSKTLDWYLALLERQGFLQIPSINTFMLTYEAWTYLTGPSSTVAIAGRAFVAMSFAREHDSIYQQGIRLALSDAGYDSVCLKDISRNGDINDRILFGNSESGNCDR